MACELVVDVLGGGRTRSRAVLAEHRRLHMPGRLARFVPLPVVGEQTGRGKY